MVQSPQQQGDRVIGVYEHESRDSPWEVRWICRGKQRSKYYKTEENAQRFAGDKQLALRGPATLPGSVHADTTAKDTRGGWLGALEKFRDILVDDSASPAQKDEAKDALRYLSQGANAAAKFVDLESVLRRLDRLEHKTERERKERASGAANAKHRKPRDAPSKA